MTIHTSQSLISLKATCLRQLLGKIGSKQTGSKFQLAERLAKDLTKSKLPSSASNSPDACRHVSRILSVDMGIKNLAYCLVTIDPIQQELSGPVINVEKWTRKNLFQHENMIGSVDSGETSLSYSPAHLLPLTLSLVHSTFLPLCPTTILIERQRFRTAGRAAVQEWTLRVNTLEAMIWAVLGSEINRGGAEHEIMIHEVSPARVQGYWAPHAKKAANGKEEKIEVVRRLFRGEENRAKIKLSDDIADIQMHFMPQTGKKREKLDDYSDCLLQAAAWVSWEHNRIQLAKADLRNMSNLKSTSIVQ